MNVRKKAFKINQLFAKAASHGQAKDILAHAAAQLLPVLCKMLQASPASSIGSPEHQKVCFGGYTEAEGLRSCDHTG